MMLSPERSVLVVVDVQERLAPAVHGCDTVVHNVRTLLHAARELRIPTLASEQYPKGLGRTVPALREFLPDSAVVEKIHFSSCGEPGFMQRLDAFGRDQIVLTGMEAHVCVLQTALGLREMGRTVFIVADGTSSRTAANAEFGLQRMRDNGVEAVTTEMVVFEWLQKAGTPTFKTLSALIK